MGIKIRVRGTEKTKLARAERKMFLPALALPPPCPTLPPIDCGEGLVNCPGPVNSDARHLHS